MTAQQGELYLRSWSLADRRAAGVVYTPSHIVDFILDSAGYSHEHRIEQFHLLDPACGAGAFLLAAFDRLAEMLRTRGLRLHTQTGSRELAKLASTNLLGIDSDAKACALARSSLRRRFEQLTDHTAPAELGRAVVTGDFLEPKGRAAQALARSNISFIVGNPPYVATNRLAPDTKNRYRQRFVSARGRIDLYLLFIEQSVRVLGMGGRFALITPNKYLTTQSGKALRRLLLESAALRTIATFRSHKIFDDAATVPCVTIADKASRRGKFDFLECSTASPAKPSVHVLRRQQVLQRDLSHEAWHLTAPRLGALAKRMAENHPPLASLASRISAGTASGLDAVFVSSRPRGIEPELERAAVRGRDIDAFQITDACLRFFLPYTFSKDGRPKLVDLRDFPHARSVLQPHRSRLEKRHCVRVWRKAWYDLHDPTPLDVASATKILVPDVADRNRFALDRGQFLPLHSAYYIIPGNIKPEYLTALLNSTPLTFIARLHAPIVKDGFSRYRRQVLANLPIPRPGSKLEGEIARAGFSGRLEELDVLAAQAFNLSPRDLEAMKKFLLHTQPELRATERDRL